MKRTNENTYGKASKLFICLIFMSVMLFKPTTLGSILTPVGMALATLLLLLLTKVKLKFSRNEIKFIVAVSLFYLYRVMRGLSSGIDVSLVKALLSVLCLVLLIVTVTKDPRYRKAIPKIFIYILCFFVVSYCATFLMSFFVSSIRALRICSIEMPGYGYTLDLYLPFTPAYGTVRFWGKTVLRLSATFRESGIAQMFYVWAISESDYYFPKNKVVKIILLLGVIACQSTAGYICLFCYLALKIVIDLKNTRNLSNLFSVLGVVILLVAVVWIYSSIPQLNLDTKNAYSTGARLGNIEDILETLKKHPFFGTDIVDYDLYGNSLFQLSAKIGLVGLFLYFHIVFRAFHMSKNRQRFLLSISSVFLTLLMSQPIYDAPIVFMMMVLPYDNACPNNESLAEPKARI